MTGTSAESSCFGQPINDHESNDNSKRRAFMMAKEDDGCGVVDHEKSPTSASKNDDASGLADASDHAGQRHEDKVDDGASNGTGDEFLMNKKMRKNHHRQEFRRVETEQRDVDTHDEDSSFLEFHYRMLRSLYDRNEEDSIEDGHGEANHDLNVDRDDRVDSRADSIVKEEVWRVIESYLEERDQLRKIKMEAALHRGVKEEAVRFHTVATSSSTMFAKEWSDAYSSCHAADIRKEIQPSPSSLQSRMDPMMGRSSYLNGNSPSIGESPAHRHPIHGRAPRHALRRRHVVVGSSNIQPAIEGTGFGIVANLLHERMDRASTEWSDRRAPYRELIDQCHIYLRGLRQLNHERNRTLREETGQEIQRLLVSATSAKKRSFAKSSEGLTGFGMNENDGGKCNYYNEGVEMEAREQRKVRQAKARSRDMTVKSKIQLWTLLLSDLRHAVE